MSNKPKDKTTKRKKQRKGKSILKRLAGSYLILLLLAGCGDDGRDNVATPLPPDLPSDYTPAPTADYSEWK